VRWQAIVDGQRFDGAGNAMTRFINAYQQACPGKTLTYTSNGSGAGVNEFIGNRTDFGGSDSPLSQDRGEYAQAKQRCGGADAWNLPVVFGPLAITYNLSSVDTLVLDTPTAAKLFNGTITRWDDPALTALNHSMPAEPIHVIYRSDASGTTDNFQQYLEAASNGAWGKGTGKMFGGVGQGAKAFAQQERLFTAKIKTAGGPDPVAISDRAVAKTIGGAKIAGQGNDLVLDTLAFYTPTQPDAYPIVLASYEIVCSKYPDAEVGKAVKALMQSTIGPGQAGLAGNGYTPLPDEFQSRVSTAVNAIS
jgi:phosphate transport system substrate-binding protein